MSAAACKAAICSSCLTSIVVDSFRELSAVTSNLAANDQFSEQQLQEIIDLYTRFAIEVERRKAADIAAQTALKEILDLDL